MEGQGAQSQRVQSSSEVNVPNLHYAIIFRDNSDGLYYGKLSNGTVELIGGAGSGAFIEQGEFSISADGSTGTINGAPIVPVDNLDGTWTITIPTIRRLKLAHLTSQSNLFVDPNNFRFAGSLGKDNGILSDSLSSLNQMVAGVQSIASQAPFGESISITDNAGNGWSGTIQNITDTSYDVLFTQNGTGLDTSVQWHGVNG